MGKNIKLLSCAEVLKALGHPVRMRILVGLICDEHCNVSKLVKNFKLPQSTISQHLAILKSRKIIEPHKTGVSTCYRVIDNRVKQIIKIFGIRCDIQEADS